MPDKDIEQKVSGSTSHKGRGKNSELGTLLAWWPGRTVLKAANRGKNAKRGFTEDLGHMGQQCL